MSQLALFPISSILLPQCVLPMHIFEERYLRLVEDCVGRELVGIIQPMTDDSHPVLCSMGCAGRIIRYEELDNGRFFVVLRGEKRFHYVSDTLDEQGYRIADVRWLVETEAPKDQQLIKQKSHLLEQVEQYLQQHQMQADLSELSNVPDIQVINSLAMLMPATTEQRQDLLEAPRIGDRLDILYSIIEETPKPKTSTIRH